MGNMVKLKIELRDIGAKRVVVVPGGTTLESLHDVIQALLGWEDCHLWMFSNNKGKNTWKPAAPDCAFVEDLDPATYSVTDLLRKVGDHAEYEYDFGDSWRHRITRMTDPKPGVEYGCVKSEGPDGVEDSRFSCDEDEDESSTEKIPTLEEINGRLPALDELELLEERVELDEKANGGCGPTLKDIVNAKSEEELRIIATGVPDANGLSVDALKKAIVDFAGSGRGFSATVEALVMSITEPYFKKFAEAAKKGSTVIENVDLVDYEVFAKFCVTHVQRVGVRDVRLFVAEEVRKAWPEMCMRLGNLHKNWDTAHAISDAALRLYGGVTFHELSEILDRFFGNGSYPEDLLVGVMGLRSYCWDSFHSVEEGTVYDDGRFDSLSEYREFARKRDAYRRWVTDDFDEFCDYADEDYFEDTPQRQEFVRFLMTTFGDSPKDAEGVANQVQAELRDGSSPAEIADMFAVDFHNPDMRKRKVAEIEQLVGDVRDNMRLAEYNGNTFASLHCAAPVLRDGPKVGRNDPCPCGSGKKYKKCCGRTA